MSEKAANVLKQFDLGGAEFVKASLKQKDKTTDIPGTYFFINFGKAKSAFVPEKSTGIARINPKGDEWHTPITPGDGFVAVNHSVLSGHDMWWDIRVAKAVFFSGGLHSALKRAGVDKPFKFFRCTVVDG